MESVRGYRGCVGDGYTYTGVCVSTVEVRSGVLRRVLEFFFSPGRILNPVNKGSSEGLKNVNGR